jgi:hypothetical protein
MLGGKGAVMTTLDGVTKKKSAEGSADQQAAAELVRLAREQGLSLTGPDGLLKQLTGPSRQQRAWSVVAVGGLLAALPLLRRSATSRLRGYRAVCWLAYRVRPNRLLTAASAC